MIWFMKPTLQVPPQVILCVLANRVTNFAGVFGFAAMEDPIPGNEHVVEDDQGRFPLAEARIAQFLQIIGCISFRGIGGVLANVSDPRRIRRGGKGNGVVFFTLDMRRLGQDHQFMAGDRPR